jgi:hypothetical protein
MITTVTNVSGGPINRLAAYDNSGANPIVDPLIGPPGIVAVGGAILDPLPFPFNGDEKTRAGLADTGTVIRTFNPQDWFGSGGHRLFGSCLSPVDQWRALVQGGKVTLGHAIDATRTDPYELFIDAVP